MPRFKCKACERRYEWKPELAGKKVKCKCGNPMLVPTNVGPAPAAKEPQAAPPAERRKPNQDDPGSTLDALSALEGDASTVELRTMEPPPRAAKAKKSKPDAESGGPGAAARWARGIKLAIFANAEESIESREQIIATFLIYAIGSFIVGLVFLFFTLHNEADNKRFIEVAQNTTAEITAAPSINRGRKAQKMDPNAWRFRTPVRYEVEGKSYEGEVLLLGDDLPAGLTLPSESINEDAYRAWVGTSIEIMYDPGDPGDSREKANVHKQSYMVWGGYGLAAAFIGVGLWGAVTKWPFGRHD